MKKLTLGFGVLFLMMALGFQAMSQSGLSVVPENPSAWDEITVRLDVSLTCPADALLEVDSVMMHSGLTIGGVSWQNTVGFDSEGANGQKPKLMKVMPSATITPANATAWDEITLTLDANMSCPAGALLGADSVMMHSGVTIGGTTWSNVINFDGEGANGLKPKLMSNGDGTWSMTFVPADFYGIEIGAEVTQICAVFNNGSWDAEGKDFDATGACTDFYIPLDGVGPTYTTWAITFTPAAFYGIAAGTDVTQIGCVFNNGTWDLEGKDWDPIEPETCIDFFIELLPPSEETMYADFEDGTNGPFTLHVMGCGEWDNAELHPVDETFFIIDNPYPSGINTSAKVMQFNRRGTDDDGQAWGGFWANNDPQFDVSLHKYVHVMVWKPKASPVKFKLEGGPSGTLEIESTNQQTETDKWVDMVFAFDTMNGTYPVCAFMPDFEDPLTSAGVVELYFDNIRVNDDPNPFDDTGIDDLNNLPAVSIAPNPCTSFLNVVVNEDLQSLEVYNLLGQQKMTFNQLSAGAFQFSTSELTKGIYIMVLRNEAGRIETVKFMKD